MRCTKIFDEKKTGTSQALTIIAIAAFGVILHSGNSLVYAADPEHGLAVAQQWCNACHSIGDEEPRQQDAGPRFEELANKDSAYLMEALEKPHDFMPDDFPQLTKQDKQDLIAYIQSQK